MSLSTSELRMGLARRETGLSPFQGGNSFVDLLCFFYLVVTMPLCASVYMCLVVICWEKG